MLGLFIESRPSSEWVIPVVQGHYTNFELIIGGETVRYYLITRRSKFRSGTRYYSRGINEHGNCANFIETEQIVFVKGQLYSAVLLSASAPIFW